MAPGRSGPDRPHEWTRNEILTSEPSSTAGGIKGWTERAGENHRCVRGQPSAQPAGRFRRRQGVPFGSPLPAELCCSAGSYKRVAQRRSRPNRCRPAPHPGASSSAATASWWSPSRVCRSLARSAVRGGGLSDHRLGSLGGIAELLGGDPDAGGAACRSASCRPCAPVVAPAPTAGPPTREGRHGRDRRVGACDPISSGSDVHVERSGVGSGVQPSSRCI